MKKVILVMVGIFALNLLAESIYGILGLMNGEKIAVYPRLQKEGADGKNHFNYWGLLSPLAVERQKTIYDTVRFSEKVIYPVAPKFELVAPNDTKAEIFVANKISKVIADTIDKIKIRLKYDYDGQSLATRNAANPKTVKLQDPKVDLWLLGTASPESAKFKTATKEINMLLENAKWSKDQLWINIKLFDSSPVKNDKAKVVLSGWIKGLDPTGHLTIERNIFW
jgi:hypothetical protein